MNLYMLTHKLNLICQEVVWLIITVKIYFRDTTKYLQSFVFFFIFIAAAAAAAVRRRALNQDTGLYYR